mgnify:CR=1 FL=1
MKATILGTDLLQDNGSVKILEINTNTAIYNVGAEFLDYDALFNVLTSNNIDEFHFIYTENKSAAPNGTSDFIFEDKVKAKCTELGITYTAHTVPVGSVTVPAIEDADNKFILRQAYDTSALVDSTYCADKFEFFSLMSGSSFIPKTYFSSDDISMDALDSLDINDSQFPNLVEKARYPKYDRLTLPKLSKHSSQDGLSESKTGLPENNLLQEFISSESNIVNGYWSIVRSIDIIYGSNLDTINMGGYTHSALIPLSFADNEFEENGVDFNKKTRSKFINKNVRTDVATLAYHTDEESDILMFDGSISNVSNIQVGDVIKTSGFDWIEGGYGDDNDPRTSNTSVELISSSLSYVSSSLVASSSQEVDDLFIQITLDNGEVWQDTPSTSYVIEKSGSLDTNFEFVNKMLVGDKIVTVNKTTNEVTKKEITSLDIVFDSKKIYNLDFEPFDFFMVDVNNDEFAIMHNACNYCGYSWSPCGYFYCTPDCPPCSGIISCFVAGTQITLFNGDVKNIEDIVVGDVVVSYNEETGIQEHNIVTDLNQPIHNDLVKYTFSNGTEITCTYDHPFYVNDLTLSSYKPEWTNERYDLPSVVSQIKVGDFVYPLAGDVDVAITSIEELPLKETQTFIFTVENNNNFYANGILVHNKKY